MTQIIYTFVTDRDEHALHDGKQPRIGMGELRAMLAGWILLAVCLLCAGLLPARWGIRLWIAIALPLATLLILHPKTPLEDMGRFDGLAGAVLGMALASALAGVAIRWFVSHFIINALQPPLYPSDVETDILRRVDGCLAVLAGLCAGLFLVLILALALRGLPGGLVLHLAVFGLASTAAILLLRHTHGPIRSAAVAALSVLAGLALLGGLY